MSFQSQPFIINISPNNTKQIVYKNLSIPIDYDLLKRNSDFFLENDNKYNSYKSIPILEDEAKVIEYPTQAIQEFIKCCQNQQIEINPSNLFYLNYLAKKYKVKKLKSATLNIISSNKGQLALESLLFSLKMSQNKNLAFIDTGSEEDIISDNFDQFIKDDKLLEIPIPILYRIVQRYFSKANDQQKVNNDEFNEFFFKLLDIHHEKASIFAQFFKIEKSRIKDAIKLHDCYSDVFDTNFLNSSLFDTAIELSKEICELKKELNEIRKISNDQKTQLKDEQTKNETNQTLLNEIKGEIEKLKDVQKSFEFLKKVQMNQIDSYQNLIPIGKKWTKGDNTNNYKLIDNDLTYEVFASSTYDSKYFVENLFNGTAELSGINSWATVSNDKDAFIKIKFPFPTVANVLLFTARRVLNQSPTLFEVFGMNNQDQGLSLGCFSFYNWKIGEKRSFAFFNEQPYQFYLIRFYKSNSEYIALSELNLGKINQ